MFSRMHMRWSSWARTTAKTVAFAGVTVMSWLAGRSALTASGTCEGRPYQPFTSDKEIRDADLARLAVGFITSAYPQPPGLIKDSQAESRSSLSSTGRWKYSAATNRG